MAIMPQELLAKEEEEMRRLKGGVGEEAEEEEPIFNDLRTISKLTFEKLAEFTYVRSVIIDDI